jgi:hypothetical protein
MSMHEREGLIARIRHLRRVAMTADVRPPASESSVDPARIERVEARLTHLEQLLEGLQDSVHRESERASRRLGDLEARTQPGALGAALNQDARDRGL